MVEDKSGGGVVDGFGSSRKRKVGPDSQGPRKYGEMVACHPKFFKSHPKFFDNQSLIFFGQQNLNYKRRKIFGCSEKSSDV